jgi:hypothetical protein
VAVPKNGTVVVAVSRRLAEENIWKFEIRSGVLADLKAVGCKKWLVVVAE